MSRELVAPRASPAGGENPTSAHIRSWPAPGGPSKTSLIGLRDLEDKNSSASPGADATKPWTQVLSSREPAKDGKSQAEGYKL